jgi:hypothetical protein
MSRVISEQLRKMRSRLGSDRPLVGCLPAQSNRFDFWFLGVLRLCLGLAQMTMSVVCGPSPAPRNQSRDDADRLHQHRNHDGKPVSL